MLSSPPHNNSHPDFAWHKGRKNFSLSPAYQEDRQIWISQKSLIRDILQLPSSVNPWYDHAGGLLGRSGQRQSRSGVQTATMLLRNWQVSMSLSHYFPGWNKDRLHSIKCGGLLGKFRLCIPWVWQDFELRCHITCRSLRLVQEGMSRSGGSMARANLGKALVANAREADSLSFVAKGGLANKLKRVSRLKYCSGTSAMLFLASATQGCELAPSAQNVTLLVRYMCYLQGNA